MSAIANYQIGELVGSMICAVAASEMFYRSMLDSFDKNNPKRLENLSANLGGASFYTLSAANGLMYTLKNLEIVPYSSMIGGALFTIYSLAVCDDKDAYKTSQVIGKTIRLVWEYTVQPAWDHIVFPLANWAIEGVIVPLSEKIRLVVGICFNRIGLPQNPIWYGVATLVAAAVAFKGLPF